jgi:RNA polymerase sigma-70 factor (ECF subfamily)
MDTHLAERDALLATRIAEHSDFLMRVARSRIADEHRAEEAVQEALLAALEGAHAFGGRATLRTWLTGILLHKIHDGYRHYAREIPHDDAELPQAVDGLTPEHALHGARLWNAFTAAVAQLPRRQAQALLLREIEGRETAEVCRRLGVSPANLWVLLHRAKARARLALAREGFAA